jgi:hypothetical protein
MNPEYIKTMYRHDFSSFVDFSFRILNPDTDYQDSPSMHVVAEALLKASRGEIKRLIINLPPRTLKSHCASIAFPAWILGRDPNKKILCLHGGNTLGPSLHDACHKLMAGPRYRELFPNLAMTAMPGQIKTGSGGGRQHLPIMGNLTGLGADIIIIDDPISALHAQDDAERQRLHDQIDQNIVQRLNDKGSGVIILIMQRLHEHDLTAYLMAKKEGWHLVDMPAIALKDEEWPLSHGRTYRRKKGELLNPTRESSEQLIEILHAIGSYNFSYQYLQGQYKPRFGKSGERTQWVTPYRHGEFYDTRVRGRGYCYFLTLYEVDFIIDRLFGTGEETAWFDNMRTRMTTEEFEVFGQWLSENHKFETHHID